MASRPPIQRTCYTRNGTAITDIAYQPCSSDPSRDAPCCGTNHQGAGHLQVANDVCDTNGLCQNFEAFDGTNQGVKNWWRQGCTDPTWQSEACLRDVCNYAKWQADNAPVQNCGGGNWCCGEKSCCIITSSLFKLAAIATAVPNSVATSSMGSASASATTIATQSSTATTSTRETTSATGSESPGTTQAASSSSSGLSTGAKAGIGVGVAVVVILLAIIAILLMKLRKRKQSEAKTEGSLEQPVQHQKPPMVTYGHEAVPVEMHAESAPVELGDTHTVELPASDGSHMKGAR